MSHEIFKSGFNVNLKGHGCWEIKFIIKIDDFMNHEHIVYPFLPMFSPFDGKMVNVVENAECFIIFILSPGIDLGKEDNKYDILTVQW